MTSEVPVLMPSYVNPGPAIDGRLSDPAWLWPEAADSFELVGLKGPASQKTEVRACYDHNTLYVAFTCFEDRMSDVRVQYTEDNQPVWQDDSVELFISPYSVAGPSKTHQFVVNVAGAKAYMRPDWVPEGVVWRAATARSGGRWVAEIAIPFDSLAPIGRNDDCWRINFCRNEIPHQEQSSWSGVRERYATYSRFGRLVPPAGRRGFTVFRSRPVPIRADASAPTGLQQITGPVQVLDAPPRILPEPQDLRWRATEPAFPIGPDTKIVIDDDAAEADLWAVDELNARIEELGGKRLDVVHSFAHGAGPATVENAIVLGEAERNPLLAAVCARDKIRAPHSRFETGAHMIDVTPERIVVRGTSTVDTYYGVQSLKQIIGAGAQGSLEVPSVIVRDYARFAFRGAHLLASKDALQFLGKLVDRVLAPLKVNQIVLQTDKVEWKSHPEVTDPANHMTQDDVAKLVEIARKHHITVTPMVQSPGHIEWAFRDKKNLAFAEDPNDPYCYCMSNPASYDFIFDIMDEAIDLLGHPEYFHAGRDEFDMRGNMPVDENCKAVGKAKLYIQDTLKIYEHLREKGCKMMMWGDILLKPGFRELAGQLPKDILINDWHYAPADAYPSLEFYGSLGFTVVGCTWFDPRNIFTFSRDADRRGIAGMMQTTWTGFQPEERVLSDYAEQAYGYVLSAVWAWNPLRPDLARLPYRPEVVFKKAWQTARDRSRSRFATVNLEGYCNISRVDSGRTVGWLGMGRGNDLRGLPEGLVRMSDVPYRIMPGKLEASGAVMLGGSRMTEAFPKRVDGIKVGAEARALHFLHACAYGADKDSRVASYVIHYADGSTREIPLVYGKDIFTWDDQSSSAGYSYAWRGRGRDDQTLWLTSLDWVNDRPDLKIESIDFATTETEASPFLVAITVEQ